MSVLILLRHGESEWNASDRFAGWVDVALTEVGRAEAVRAGHLLTASGNLPDVLFTSLLRRAIDTAALAADACNRHWIPVRRSWCLNERHYGALQGQTRPEVLATFGEQKFTAWRRSYEMAPPPAGDVEFHRQKSDARYTNLANLPRAESLAAVTARLLPYWSAHIVPELAAGRTVCITAHGNSLRALIKHLDAMSDETFMGLNVPTGIPLVYELDEAMRPLTPRGTYLEPVRSSDRPARKRDH